MNIQKSGLLLINKPQGPTSAQVVHRVKKHLGARKAGHLGTLDPFASGLLLIGINEGTKIADFFLGGDKRYSGVIALGAETDTLDLTGTVLHRSPVPTFDERQLQSLVGRFTGELAQVPPMYSALKRDGVRLYKLARRGIAIDRPPRKICIYTLQLRRISDVEIGFDVSCSGGTYIRTLASDIGRTLGCGAYLKSLTRTACSHLSLSTAISLDDFEALAEPWAGPLLPLANALCQLPEVRWETSQIVQLQRGQQALLRQLPQPVDLPQRLRVSTLDGDLVALITWHSEGPGRWQIERVFNVE